MLLPIISLFLAGCTIQDLPVIGGLFGGGGKTTEPVTLVFWGLWEDSGVMNVLIQKYQEQNPNVTINYEDRSIMTTVDYKERIFTRSQQSSGIDLALVHNTWVPDLVTLLAPMPKNLMDVSQYTTSYYPVAAQSAVFDGEIYAVPAYYDGLVLVYNKKHFKEIGQNFPPTAWEEFRRLAIELTVRGPDGELKRGGAAIGTAKNIDHSTDIVGLMMAQAGIAVPEQMDTKPAQDALTFYTNFAKVDKVWSEAMPNATEAFTKEQASMIFVPTWQILDILKAMPNINDVGVAAVPQALIDNPVSWGSFWMYAVPSNSTNSAVAWDFINFLAQPEQQQLYFSEASKIRAFGPPYSAVSLKDTVANPYITPVLDSAPFAKSSEIAGRAGNRRQADALNTSIEEVLSGASAKDALSRAKVEIEK
ncbi:extracellular solute-binding protein [Candidatus Nomurabacteria bacterium]|uniref:Extracellular solute-binding protein n=1 Tax=candidate division WWE3 bacterium TaxID=2053526 RepID=A0A955E1D7_UNCKA|nr:extracellular solute-binding protein [candidate division WWE3 bacterium]MCB9823495.1 extracellular solute-binding protein [Candidatus Nomurabacteria bacterium]MCB9827777.1 extracellular solute-binding protein [Candidatus Nomurabacteria bacterium]HXK52382.1 extracellular solute-binding protein [bacterium]